MDCSVTGFRFPDMESNRLPVVVADVADDATDGGCVESVVDNTSDDEEEKVVYSSTP